MTRTEYLDQFAPANRNHPALLWDRNHGAAVCALPPTESVIEYGVALIASFEVECAELRGDEPRHARRLATGQIGVDREMARYRDFALRAIARHREFNGGADHVSVSSAADIDFIGFYIDNE